MIIKVKLVEMIGKATVMIVTEGTAQEMNGLRAEMIKTLPPLAITLLILF
jgi:hypothetical protein